MKNPSYTIHIDNPCKEDWDKMNPSAKGRFCTHCSKNVMDFTQSTDKEIVKILKHSTDLCGRFKQSQLQRELILDKEKSTFHSLQQFFAGLLLFSLTNDASASSTSNQILELKELAKNESILSDYSSQKKNTVLSDSSRCKMSGKIIDKASNEPLIGVVLMILGTPNGTQTDKDGNYHLDFPDDHPEDTVHIEITYAGYETIHFSVCPNDLPLVKDFYMMEDVSTIKEIVLVGGYSFKTSICQKKKWWQFWKKGSGER